MQDKIFRLCSALGNLISSIVHDGFCNGSYKKWRKPRGGCPLAHFWQDQAEAAANNASQVEAFYKRRESNLHVEHKQELEKKEREISYLRSQLYK